ncbi:MAG: biotin/lipoyl-binding protein, partial [Chloroflexota bacterium]
MNRRKLIILAVIVVIVGGGLWWGTGANSTVSSADIVTSGFIEATDTAISLEMNGRIVEIAAGEGDSVKAGALLVRLDDSLLKAQEKQAEANVALARARLQQALVAQDRAKLVWETALE